MGHGAGRRYPWLVFRKQNDGENWKMTRISATYTIRCTKNARVYIGSSVNVHTRIKEHKTLLRNSTHHNPALQAAWNKYGEDGFEFLFTPFLGDAVSLRLFEQRLIEAEVGKVFNATSETRTPFDDPAVRAKSTKTRNSNPDWLRNAAEGRRNSPIFLAAVRQSGIDNAHHLRRPEVQEKRVAALRLSEKHKAATPIRIKNLATQRVRELAIDGMNNSPIVQAIRAAAKQKRDAKQKRKTERADASKVVGTNVKTGEVRVFASIAVASTMLSIEASNISRVVRGDGRRNMAGGWSWARHGK